MNQEIQPNFGLTSVLLERTHSVDHAILKSLVQKRVKDDRALALIDTIIDSFIFQEKEGRQLGIPLGNVTSQLFANIYLHELDLFVKHTIRKKWYLRFCDDFLFVSDQETELWAIIPLIRFFLREELRLELHPKKVIIQKLHQGVDFLGYVVFLHHRTLRTRTKKRLKQRLKKKHSDYIDKKIGTRAMDRCLQSYLGIQISMSFHRH